MFLLLGEYWKPLPLIILGIWTTLSSFLVLLLPETHGQPLPATIREAEMLGKDMMPLPSDVEEAMPAYV